jgi:CheY-like chemotaxis protein
MPPIGCIRLAKYGEEGIAYMIGEGEFSDRTKFPFPTIVITDLKMSDGDGFDVLEFMQANPEWSVVPRIMFSSSGNDDDVRTAYALGVSAFHVKPASANHYGETLKSILRYWATTEVPPVDANGRLLTTKSHGRLGQRYPQVEGGKAMRRPRKPNESGIIRPSTG